jgi:hypothetical protein
MYNATPRATTISSNTSNGFGLSCGTTTDYLTDYLTTTDYSVANFIPSTTFTLTNNMNKVQNQFVAIFKIERNDKNEITSAKFIKEMWIETKNGSSVDFEVAKDPEISKYKADEISIRTIYTVTF